MRFPLEDGAGWAAQRRAAVGLWAAIRRARSPIPAWVQPCAAQAPLREPRRPDPRRARYTSPMTWLDEVKWDRDGLVPVIAQERGTGDVLMFAWMNRDALERTAQTQRAVYWSRSRQKLWAKGEESGHVQQVHQLRLDCDNDRRAARGHPTGPRAGHRLPHWALQLLLPEAGGWRLDAGRTAVLKDPRRASTNERQQRQPGSAFGVAVIESRKARRTAQGDPYRELRGAPVRQGHRRDPEEAPAARKPPRTVMAGKDGDPGKIVANTRWPTCGSTR